MPWALAQLQSCAQKVMSSWILSSGTTCSWASPLLQSVFSLSTVSVTQDQPWSQNSTCTFNYEHVSLLGDPGSPKQMILLQMDC